MDTKSWIIVVLGIACAVLAWLQFGGDTVEVGGKDIMQQRFDSIASENKRLESILSARMVENQILESINDSLEAMEPRIIFKFKDKYHEMDNLTANGLAREFDRVFADAGIK